MSAQLKTLLSKKPVEVAMIDDNDDDRSIFAMAIAAIPVPVHLTATESFENVTQLLQERENVSPDIIFLDLNMPRKNGYDCLREIRKDARLENTPVVIYSTSTNTDDITKTLNGGATMYLPKPYSYTDLKSALQRVLNISWPEKGENMEPFVFDVNDSRNNLVV